MALLYLTKAPAPAPPRWLYASHNDPFGSYSALLTVFLNDGRRKGQTLYLLSIR